MGNKCPCLAPKTGGSKGNGLNEEGKAKKKDKKNNEKNKKKQGSKYAMPPDGADNEGFDEQTQQDTGEFTNIANIAPNGEGPKSSTYQQNSTGEVDIVLEKHPNERPVDVPGEPKVNYKATKSPDSNHNNTGEIEIHQGEGQGVVSLDDGNEIIDTRLRLPSADLDLDQLTDSQKDQYVNAGFEKDSLSSSEDISEQQKDVKLEQAKPIIEPLDNLSQSFSSLASSKDNSEVALPESDILPDDIDLKFDDAEEIQHLKHKTFETKFQFPQEGEQDGANEEQVGAVGYVEPSEDKDSDSEQDDDMEHLKHKTYETQVHLKDTEEPEVKPSDASAYEISMQLQRKQETDSETESEEEREFIPKLNDLSDLQRELDIVSEVKREASPDINNIEQMQKEDVQQPIDSDIDDEVEINLQKEEQNNKVILDGANGSLPNESSDFDIAEKTDDRESVSSISSEEYQEMAGATANLDTFPSLTEIRPTPLAKDNTMDFVEEANQQTLQTENIDTDLGNVYMDMQRVQRKEQMKPASPDIIGFVQTSVHTDRDEGQVKTPMQEKDEGVSSESESDHSEAEDVVIDHTKPVDVVEETKVDERKTPLEEEESEGDENRELEEILMLIEKLEDSLVEDLATSQDAETLSRNIVEKLDEISALREQAEMDMPIETIMEEMQEDEEEDEQFQTEDQIIDWYNRRLDELNEAVGMDLLEMSMTKSLTDETLEPLFNQHAESHTYFIRRRLVELEKLRRKKLVTNQKPMFEPKPEEEIELHRPTRPKMYHSDDDSEKDEDQSQPGKVPKSPDLPAQVEKDEVSIEQYQSYPSQVVDEAPAIAGSTHPALLADATVQQDNFIINQQQQNVFEESDVEMGPGVNQFVSPSKSEEDLWFKVESLQSKEVIPDRHEEEMEIEKKIQTQQKVEAYDSVDQKADIDRLSRGESPIETQQVTSQQSTHTHDATKIPGKSILKASMMYGSDSDSENASETEEDFRKLEDIKIGSLNGTQPFDVDKVSNEFEDDNVYSTPSSLPVRLSQTDVSKPQQQEDVSPKSEFVYNVTEYGNNVNELTGKALIKARMVSRSSSESSSASSSEDENVKNQLPVTVNKDIDEANYQDEDSEDEPVYSVPTSIPVRPTVTDTMNRVDYETVNNKEKEETFEVSAQEGTKVKVKPTMYGSSSDDSETEELVQKAYAMDGGVSSSESEVHPVSVIKPQVVQDNQNSSELTRDSSPPGDQFGAAVYSEEEEVVEPNDIFGEFQSDTFDRLQSSQDHAKDLLSELQALSGQKQDPEYSGTVEQKSLSGKPYSDDEYSDTSGQREVVDVSKEHNDIVFGVRHTADADTNISEPYNATAIYETFDLQVNKNNTEESSQYIPVIGEDQKHELDQNIEAPAVYQAPPGDFSSASEGLMSLTMQPLPPVLDDDHKDSEKNIQICSKETGESYPVSVGEGADTSPFNGHQKLSRKHSREILLSESSDTDTDELIKAAVGKQDKQAATDDVSAHSSATEEEEEDDTDTEGVIQKYGEALTFQKAQPITTLYSDSEDSRRDSSESEEDEEFEAEQELKETLKEDIVGNIGTLNKDDFSELMGIYRQERAGIRDVRDREKARVGESLMEKLQRRRQAVDDYVHDGGQGTTGVGVQVSPVTQSASVGGASVAVSETGVGDGGLSDSETSDMHEEDEEVEQSIRDVEELTQTIQLMDLEIVQHAAETGSRDEVNEILKGHFDMVEQLRRNKDTSLQDHRNKAKARMEARNRKLSTSSSDDSCNDENTGGKDAFIDKEMDSLRESYLEAITSRDTVSEQELHDIIVQYREDQQDLIRKREFEKLRINEKLRERLRESKQRQRFRHTGEEVIRQEGQAEGGQEAQAGERDTELLSQMSRMDEDFYKELFRLHALGQLDEEEMGHMIEEHLDRAEEFKRKVTGEVEKRRRKRDKMTDSRKMKHADLIIQTEKEEAQKIRQMREQEKQVSDLRLQEKLQRKKKYEDTPELPPPKRLSKNKKSKSTHMQIDNYKESEPNLVHTKNHPAS